MGAGEIVAASPLGLISRFLRPAPPETRSGPLAIPPNYSVTVGRNPGAPGALDESYKEMRQLLLGSTVFDVQCQDLQKFNDAGGLFMRMAISYFVFAGVGMILAIISLALASSVEPCCVCIEKMPINLMGNTAWLIALILQICALAVWGGETDVAACVTSEGGAAVCDLGAAAALSITSIVFTLIATGSYCVFFTHKFIHDLREEKEREKGLREATERQRQPGVELEQQVEGGGRGGGAPRLSLIHLDLGPQRMGGTLRGAPTHQRRGRAIAQLGLLLKNRIIVNNRLNLKHHHCHKP